MDSPDGPIRIFRFFLIKKCRHDSNKLKFKVNISSEEWSALICLNIVIKAADKGSAVVIWRANLYQGEALRQLSDEDLTFINQTIVKNTIYDLITEQELPATIKSHTTITPKTSCIHFLPRIHKPNNPGRPIVSGCGCPTKLISRY